MASTAKLSNYDAFSNCIHIFNKIKIFKNCKTEEMEKKIWRVWVSKSKATHFERKAINVLITCSTDFTQNKLCKSAYFADTLYSNSLFEVFFFF